MEFLKGKLFLHKLFWLIKACTLCAILNKIGWIGFALSLRPPNKHYYTIYNILIDRLFKPLFFAEVTFKQIIPLKALLKKLKLDRMTFLRKTKGYCDINHIDMLPNCAFWENSRGIIDGDFRGAIKGSIHCENFNHGAF